MSLSKDQFFSGQNDRREGTAAQPKIDKKYILFFEENRPKFIEVCALWRVDEEARKRDTKTKSQ